MLPIFSSLLILTVVISTPSIATEFPKDFVGEWQGPCTVHAKTEVEFSMSLKVTPIAPRKYTWIVDYKSKTIDQRRPYELIIDATDPSSFTIDEKNGLILPGSFVACRMTQLFSLNTGAIVSSTIEVSDNKMYVTMPMWDENKVSTSTTTDKRFEARSFALKSFQECFLERVQK